PVVKADARTPAGRTPLLTQAPSRTLLLTPAEEDELAEVDGLVAGSAVAGPTAQDGLQEQHRLGQCQAGRRAEVKMAGGVGGGGGAVGTARGRGGRRPEGRGGG